MKFSEQLELLKAAQRDPALLALAIVDIAYSGLTPGERARIKAALMAAAVPHWCDSEFLAALLNTTSEEGHCIFAQLKSLTLVEPFPARGLDAVSVQAEARLELRRHVQRTDPEQFSELVDRAHRYVCGIDSDDSRVEAIFHRLSLDRRSATSASLELYSELERRGAGDTKRLLFTYLIEVIEMGHSMAPPQQVGLTAVTAPSSVFAALPVTERHAVSALTHFDVFLCHNSQDKHEVEEIGIELRKRNLRPWLDKWELPPGRPWQQLLEEQIETIGAAAVCVGRSGLGPWQNSEHRAFLSEFQRRSCPVIPVILSSVSAVPRLPPFLAGMTWVDFRDTASTPYSLLVWGVTGKRPVDLP